MKKNFKVLINNSIVVIVVVFFAITLLTALFLTFTNNKVQRPVKDSLVIKTGTYSGYTRSVKLKIVRIHLNDGSSYIVNSFYDNKVDSLSNLFYNNVKKGMPITLGLDNNNRVMEIKVNNKVYLSFDESIKVYDRNLKHNEIAKKIMYVISGVLFLMFIILKKNKKNDN